MSSSFPKPARRRSASQDRRDGENRNRQPRTALRRRRPEAEEERPASGGARVPEAERNRRFPGEAPGGIASPAASGAPAKPRSTQDDEEAPVMPGVKPVLELLQSAPERVDAVFLRKGRHGKDMERIVDLCRMAGVRFSLLDPASFARVYEGHSQGVVARLFEAGFADLDNLLDAVMDAPLPLVLALDQVQDPGNAGTLARTAYALGCAGLLAPRHNGVYLGAAAAKAAAGALEKLPVAKAGNLGQAIDKAKKLGFTVYGAVSDPGNAGKDRTEAMQPADQASVTRSSIFEIQPRLPALLVLGSEEAGMRSGIEKRCDCLVHIPMLRDFDSLNVAQAGGILISWFAHCALRART